MNPALLVLSLVLAQSAPAAKAAAPPPHAETPAYEADLLKLSEMMGALSYLRDVCRFGDGAAFREHLAGLIQSDAGAQEVKDRMAGAFNRGLEGYRLTYRVCTSNARATISDFLTRSQNLAKEVASRYGPG